MVLAACAMYYFSSPGTSGPGGATGAGAAGSGGGDETSAPTPTIADELPPVPTFVVEELTTDAEVRAQLSAAGQAVATNPRDAAANGTMGMLFELYQYPDSALACYQRAALLAPSEFRWRYHLARMQRSLGQLNEAVATLQQAAELNATYVPAIALLGDVYFELGKIDEADEAYKRALALAPNSVSALLGSGRILADRDQHDRAAQLYLAALGHAPTYGPLHYAMAISRRALGETELAQKHLEFAGSAAGGNPDRDELLAAVFALEKGVDADYRRAKDLFNQNQFQACIAQVQSILKRQPEHFGALGVLGQCYLRTGQDAEAIKAFEEGLRLNPTNLTFLRHHGLLMLRASRFADAEADFRKVMELGVDHPDDHYLFGFALMQVGKLDEARAEFERTLATHPDREDARGALVQTLEAMLAQASAAEQAGAYARRLTELRPDDARYWRSLGVVLSEMNRTADAVAALQRSLDLNPEQADLKHMIEQLQRSPGNVDG